MATVRDPVKPEPVAKYETLVERRLAQARTRIRGLDLTAAFLGLLIGTMAFGLIMALADRWFQLSTQFRQIAFCIYGLIAVVYLARAVAWPLLRRVNPYYAALQVEHSLPAAKNSVVNWLDLRQQSLPPAIRGAVSHRAALDISHADMDEAISPRQVLRLGAAAVGLFVVFIAVALFGPGVGRVFQPFSSSNRTELIIVKPEGGNATVSVARQVDFEVAVEGRKPDSVRFLFRRRKADPYEERAMEPGGSSRQWVTTISALELSNGFWYKVAGGGAETEEFRIDTRSSPMITGFEVTYHPRAYMHLPDVTSDDRNLKGIRGTQVQLVTRTNRKIRYQESGLVFSDTTKESIAAQPVAGNPQAMQFPLVLDKDGLYHIKFVADDGEQSTDPISYSIKVQPDNPPVVVLTKPEQEKVSLPANGILSVEGSATDDFGITGFKLRMQTNPKDGSPKQSLPDKPYRPGTSFKLPDGSDRAELEYKDFVELNKVANGQPLPAGTVVEYWLEAIDNCDFPAPNVGRSRSKFLTITEPAKDQEKIDQQKKQANQEQKNHEAKQDKQLNKPEQEDKPQNGNNPKENGNNPKEGGKPDQQNKLQDTEKKLQGQLQKENAAEQGKAAETAKPSKSEQAGQGDQNQGLKEEQIPMPRPDGKGDQESGKGDQESLKKAKGAAAKKGSPDPNQQNPDENKAPDDKDGPQKGAGQQKDGKKPPDDKVKKNEGPDKLKPEKPEDRKKENKGKPNAANPTDIKGNPKDSPKPGMKEGDGNQGQEQAVAKEAKEKQKQAAEKKPGPNGIKGGTEAEKPSAEPPKHEADPALAPAKAKNPMPDKGNNGPDKNKQAGKDPGKADKPEGQPGDKGKSNPQANPAKANDGKRDQKANGQDPMGKPGANNDAANPGKKPNEQNPGQGAENLAGQAKKEIDQLAKAMKSGDPKAREEARQKLEDLSKKAKQQSDRQAAAEALKKAAQEMSGADSNNAQKNQQGDPKADANKGEKGNGLDQKQAAKDKGPEGADGKPAEKAAGKDGQRGDKPGSSGKGVGDQKQGKTQETAKGGGGQTSGKTGSSSGGNNQGNYKPTSSGSGLEAEEGSKANVQFQKKAGVLQLEEAKKRLKELKEKANDEFLKKANVTKEDLQQYLKYEEERLRHLEAQIKKDEKLRDPTRGGGSLSNLGVRRVQSSENKEDDLSHANQADAPPELREANREFTQLLAKPERVKEKK
jgi:hypothetical protein